MNRSIKCLICSIVLLFLSTALFGGDSKKDYWPGEEWRRSTPEEQGMDSRKIFDMIEQIRDNQYEIHSLLIIRNGYLVTEAYFFPRNKGITHSVYSCTNSVTSALIGIAINDGYIKSVDEKVLGLFPELKAENIDEKKKNMTIKDLLTMSSGLQWNEKSRVGENNDFNLMIKSDTPVKYVLDRPMNDEPGKVFLYNSGAAHVLSGIVQKTTGKKTYDYAKEKLFDVLGIKDVFWGEDREGVNYGGYFLYMTPFDMAKFGYLYLKKGKWNDRQVIPEKWVEESSANKIRTLSEFAGSTGYGYQWWIDENGSYSAWGAFGQHIYVIPDHELVVVFTGGLAEFSQSHPQTILMHDIIPSIMSDAPIKKNYKSNNALNLLLKEMEGPPKPRIPARLPEIAGKISGKVFEINDKSSFSLTFNSPGECIFTQIEDGVKYESKVGLDGVYRISQTPYFFHKKDDFDAALKGFWFDDSTFYLQFRELKNALDFEFRFTFNNDEAAINLFSYYMSGIVNKETARLKK